jgi:quinol-cytochrome oxidoreductase complex cytochrome b subunit
MDADRLRTGELIAAVSAVALFIIMFLPWFGVGGVAGEALEQAQDLGFAGEVETSANAWESFDFIDLVLLVTIVIAVGLAVATMAAQTVALPVAASAITAGLGVLSTLLILYRIIDPPGDADRKFWVFLGLIAAAGIAYGGWRAMQEEGTSFGGEADRVRGRGEPPPPSAPPPPPPSSQGPAA